MDYHLSATWIVVLILLLLWELAWKGAALWKAAQTCRLGWFIALLLINSAGILPIVFLLTHVPRYPIKKEALL